MERVNEWCIENQFVLNNDLMFNSEDCNYNKTVKTVRYLSALFKYSC